MEAAALWGRNQKNKTLVPKKKRLDMVSNKVAGLVKTLSSKNQLDQVNLIQLGLNLVHLVQPL